MKFTIKSLALSGVALGMLTAVANAADLDPVVSTSDWTGFSIGIGGGGSFSFAETNAAGGGEFDVSGDSGWMNNDYFDGEYTVPASGAGNTAYTNHDQDSGGAAQLSAAASMGNAGSLIADFLEGFESDNNDPNDTGHAGFLGTSTIGADYQLDRFVFGVDAAFSLGRTEIKNQAQGEGGGEIDIEDSGDIASGDGDGDARLDTSLELGNSWSVGARAGFLATDSTLIFGSAGYTSTNAKLKAHFNGDADAEVSGGGVDGDASASWDVEAETEEWMGGYYVGGGVEQLLTSSLSLKVEYRYADLGTIETFESLSESGGVPNEGYTWDAQVGAEADVTTHSVVATVNFRF